MYEFGSEKKPNWSNLPVTFVPRNGVRLGDLTKEQRAKAMDVVAAVLSKERLPEGRRHHGRRSETGREGPKGGKGKDGKGKGKGGKGPMFGADLYYLAIFGKPSETKPWMVQFGGHHLGVNVTVIGKNFVLTPTHTGAQPTLFKRDDKEVRPLGQENDTAFKLVDALDEKQRAQAIIGERPQQELLLGPGRDGKKIEPKGIKGSALTADQQAMLLDVIGAWVNIVEPDAAAARMAAIKEKIGETYFAWSGPTEKGKRGLLPRAGADRGDRIRPAGRHRPHSHGDSQSRGRLRGGIVEAMKYRRFACQSGPLAEPSRERAGERTGERCDLSPQAGFMIRRVLESSEVPPE